MENEPELIRDQMQETRTALTDKLEALEHQVVSTVQNTTSAVADTVESVKQTVQDTVGTVKDTVQSTVETVQGTVDKTVETVKDTFDLPAHVDRHPWLMLGGSVAVGFIAGRLLSQLSPSSPRIDTPASSFPDSLARYTSSAEPRRQNGAESREPEEKHESWLSSLMDNYREEIDTLKGMGVAAVVGVIRDLATQSVHGEIGSRLKEWMNDLTEKMGGKPFQQPLVEPTSNEPSEESTSTPEHGTYSGPAAERKGTTRRQQGTASRR